MKKFYKIATLMALLAILSVPSYAWSNGGYSDNIGNPKYGTHDLILNKAIDMLPQETKAKINRTLALYGSEIPDCTTGIYCIGDNTKHHVYYYKNKTVQHDIGAKRSQEEYNRAKYYLSKNDIYNFSIRIGAMSHYISDVAVFGHTMGTETNWGQEIHHSDYESYVQNHNSDFSGLYFDGGFTRISAYNASLKMAKETTFNLINSGKYTNVWMDKNYNFSNSTYKSRTKSLINYGTNIIADVIYTMADTKPPASVTLLKNITYKPKYINWTWKDPINKDFSSVKIYINGVYKTGVPKGMQYYNATGLNPGTWYKIGIRTVDMNGNVGNIVITNSAKTAPILNCDQSYPTVCIPPPPPDLDCSDITYRNFQVIPPDSHRFDNDGDGIGCET